MFFKKFEFVLLVIGVIIIIGFVFCVINLVVDLFL